LIDLLKSNPDTLFVIAAGNAGLEVHQETNDDLPASAPVQNKLVVAAVNRSDFSTWTEEDRKTLALTFFSNFGITEVDVAAPGDEVSGALLGGGTVRLSGTSMASPLAMNVVMKMKELNANLSGSDIKKILCDTAFIPNQPLPVRCKGVIDPVRALKAAELSKTLALPQAIKSALR
jgi:subtilisin family serine protease